MRKNGILAEKSARMQQSKVNKRKENNTSSSLSSSSEEEDLEKQQEELEIIYDFFFRNWYSPQAEFYTKFLPWNNCAGRCWSTMTHDQRLNAAALWRQQPETLSRFSNEFLQMWQDVVNALLRSGAPISVVKDALSDDIAWNITHKVGQKKTLTLICSRNLQSFLEQNIDLIKPILKEYHGNDFSLFYCNPEE